MDGLDDKNGARQLPELIPDHRRSTDDSLPHLRDMDADAPSDSGGKVFLTQAKIATATAVDDDAIFKAMASATNLTASFLKSCRCHLTMNNGASIGSTRTVEPRIRVARLTITAVVSDRARNQTDTTWLEK